MLHLAEFCIKKRSLFHQDDHLISGIIFIEETMKYFDLQTRTLNGFELVTEEMRGEAERARVFGEDGDDVVRQVVAVRRHVTVHVVLHRPREVTDPEILTRLPRRLVKTKQKQEEKEHLCATQ